MPKFKTFSGFVGSSSHLKSFDSQLSFYASDDEAEIKKLIRRGHLCEFVKKDQAGSPRKPRELSPRRHVIERRQEQNCNVSPHIIRRVDTISGGIAGGGDTSNARRKYAWRVVHAMGSASMSLDISFSDNELVGLELSHDDALVTNPIISNFVVAQMLFTSI
ncbi:hypothetical protein LIER_16974 [Lithospermum erythrorhizon]|uniref:Uncharacterized protein n=1 Tax=Lithospermum erythrorhizon TaxID=34254 RepID=A0AAV3QCQ5_LITER